MPRVLVLSGLIAASLITVVIAAPQTPNPGPSQPFSKLFGGDRTPSRAVRLSVPAPSTTREKPQLKVVCGTLILVPERIDPDIVKRPKAGVTYTMRLVPPPACAAR